MSTPYERMTPEQREAWDKMMQQSKDGDFQGAAETAAAADKLPKPD